MSAQTVAHMVNCVFVPMRAWLSLAAPAERPLFDEFFAVFNGLALFRTDTQAANCLSAGRWFESSIRSQIPKTHPTTGWVFGISRRHA